MWFELNQEVGIDETQHTYFQVISMSRDPFLGKVTRRKAYRYVEVRVKR